MRQSKSQCDADTDRMCVRFCICILAKWCAGIVVDGQHVKADAVVVALGPWTNTLASSLQLPHISGQLGHSLVLKPSSSEPLPADCLFVSWQSNSGTAIHQTLFRSINHLKAPA